MQKVQKIEHKAAKPATIRKIMGIVVNIGFVLALVLAISIVFFMVQDKLSGGTPKIGGFRMFIVLSGSMEPVLHTGSMVFVQPQSPESFLQNDIITFKSPDGSDKLITHRIASINQDKPLSFVTKGDANNSSDAVSVLATDVVGRVSFDIPYIGYLMSFARTKVGLLVLIIIPALFIILLEIRKLFQYVIQLDREKEAEKQEFKKLEDHKKEWEMNEPVEADVTSMDQK